jgi:hypothetical protein
MGQTITEIEAAKGLSLTFGMVKVERRLRSS